MSNEVSEQAFQDAYVRFLTQASFREAVYSGWAAKDKSIAPDLIKRLQSMEESRTSLFAELLITNRLATIQEALPITATILGDSLLEVVYDFNDTVPTKDHRKYPEARTFAHYLLDRLENEPLGSPYLSDVLTYELAGLQLRFEYDCPIWHKDILLSSEEFARYLSNGKSVYIYRHPYQALLSFSFNIEKICEEIAISGRLLEAEPELFTLLLHVNAEGILLQDAINTITAGLLFFIDGNHTFQEVVQNLNGFFNLTSERGCDEHDSTVKDICIELLQRGVIGFTVEPI